MPLIKNVPSPFELEARAEALLGRIQRHNRGLDSITALEVRSLLAEIQAIRRLNIAGSLPEMLARVDRIMKQAVEEASRIVESASGHGMK